MGLVALSHKCTNAASLNGTPNTMRLQTLGPYGVPDHVYITSGTHREGSSELYAVSLETCVDLTKHLALLDSDEQLGSFGQDKSGTCSILL
jgi:hypothetical protein